MNSTTRRLYAIPTGEVALVESMAEHMADPEGAGWAVVYWGSREDYDTDMVLRAADDPWADHATFSVVVDTEEEALTELGEGAVLAEQAMSIATITATDGRKATAPAQFAAKWDQAIIDSLVMQAHRGGVADRATCNVVGVEAV